MASAMFLNIRGTGGGTMELSADNGKMTVNYGHVLERQTLPTDPIGSMGLTLTNVVVGSTYDIEDGAGGVAASGTASSSTVTAAIPVYQSGNVRNNLKIKVRKASGAPYYQSYETRTTASLTPQSLFINQLSDE
jgi:hypothetical protein